MTKNIEVLKIYSDIYGGSKIKVRTKMVQEFNYNAMNLDSINTYLNQSGVEINAEDKATLNSIFKESDTENAKGEQKADGELSRKERHTFLTKIKSVLPKLYQKLVEFTMQMEMKEDIETQNKATLERLKQEQKEQKQKEEKENIHFG